MLVPFNKEMLSYIEMKHAEIIPGGVLDTGKYYLPARSDKNGININKNQASI